jgi:riboflavin kinase
MPGSDETYVIESKSMKSEMRFPHYATGLVVKGFGRGSKQLGIPTANYPDEVVEKLPECFNQGVYFGYAQVENGPVYKMVMSIGTNPYYNNEKKTMVSFFFFFFLPIRLQTNKE